MEKKPAEPKLSPGEMVSREAKRVEEEVMIDLLETAVRTHLFQPFQIDSKIWFEPATMSYCVKLRAVGKDEKGKTHVVGFTGYISDLDISLHATDSTSWRNYMDLTVRAWIEEMIKKLHQGGATRLLTGHRKKSYVDLKGEADDLSRKIDAFSAATKRMAASFDVASEKMYTLGNQLPKTYAWVDPPPPSLGEMRELKESLRQSAERRRTS